MIGQSTLLGTVCAFELLPTLTLSLERHAGLCKRKVSVPSKVRPSQNSLSVRSIRLLSIQSSQCWSESTSAAEPASACFNDTRRVSRRLIISSHSTDHTVYFSSSTIPRSISSFA
ncbi:hypothetical protein K402DRAFT_182877 [Aulographum hederae CBS 113979]|uniref:Uncharacterized protein n=1 Tax=Aulographum hederae CBS 113979 TaxID=1176131 RepID=A0A6G1GQ69_9PEZI|nr:hypothetical protein K402DRAFT_182877 [Aulographum hederae CBS 113979]